MTSPVADRAIVITGAGDGIGRALARRFAAAGARLAVNDLDPAACESVAAEVGAMSIPGDAAAGAAELVHVAAEALDGIDMFFANAGVGTAGDTDADWALAWEVNVMAHVRAFRALAPAWLDRGQGRFVATVSAAGLLTMLGAAAYSATKHAALAHAEWLSTTYGNRGIVVQALCPQGVRTKLAQVDSPAGQVVLAPTLIEPEDVAETVLSALASREFLILPHPEVRAYYELRAHDTDRWLTGMRHLQEQMENLSDPGT